MKKLLLSGFALAAMMTQAQNSWIDQGTKFATSFGVDELVIVDANTAWVNAYDGTGAGTYPKVVSRTTNGGTTWTAFPITGPGTNSLVGDLAAVDANTAWVATAGTSASPNSNAIWKTTNGGSTWTRQTIGYTGASFTNLVYFWNANEGWTGGDPKGGVFETYKTTNGGTTWTAVTGLPLPDAADEYGLTGAKTVTGDHIWFGTTKGRIFHSTNRGATWTANYSPALDFGGGAAGGGVDGSSAKMTFKDGLNGFLLTVDGQTTGGTPSAALYSSSDGGATWVPITPTGTWYFGDITYVPGTTNTLVTTGINGADASYMGSAYSTDGGLTWTGIDAGSQRGKVKFLNATTGWAGQFSDGPSGTKGILKFSGNLALATSENAVKSSLKVYPNPATDIVNISSNRNIESVTITDLSGKRVDSGKGSQINVSKLAKGTYILQVNYGGGAVENTKLIKK